MSDTKLSARGSGRGEDEPAAVDEEEERERMKKIREKLAKKKWVFDSDSETEEGDGDDAADSEVLDDDVSSDDSDDEGKEEGKGTKEKEQEKERGKKTEPSPRTPGRPGEEKSIEYLLKKYYSKDALPDDFVRVGDKWVSKADLTKKEHEKKKQLQHIGGGIPPSTSLNTSGEKSQSIKKVDLASLKEFREKEKERGKDKEKKDKEQKEKEQKDKDKESGKEKKKKKKVMSPPLSPRNLLSFSKEKRKQKADRGASQPSNSPVFKRASSSSSHTEMKVRRRSATQSQELVDDAIASCTGESPPSSSSYAAAMDLEDGKDREREAEKRSEKRRSLGIHFFTSDPKTLRGEGGNSSGGESGSEDKEMTRRRSDSNSRWSGDYNDLHQNQPAQRPYGTAIGAAVPLSKKEERKKRRLSAKLPAGKLHQSSPASSSGDLSSPNSSSPLSNSNNSASNTNSNTNNNEPLSPSEPPPAPPPPQVTRVREAEPGAKTLARELSEVYCYSDRREIDFREEMLKREQERKKLVELKKTMENSEKESQRRKKESVKDENKKAKWGLLFSLPQDVRKLKQYKRKSGGGGEDVIVSPPDEDDEETEEEVDSMTKEEVEKRARLLDLQLERTISQLLLVDPEEGERLLAQKLAEEEKRKKALLEAEKEDDEEV